MGVDRRAARTWLTSRVLRSGRSHEDLAAAAGISRKTIDRLVAGRGFPSLATLYALGSVLPYSRRSAEALHRGEAPSEVMAGKSSDPGLTAEQLARLLMELPPDARRLPARGFVTGAAVIGIKVVAGAVLIRAAIP